MKSVLGGEDYNTPTLRPLWDARERRDGVLCPSVEALLLDKLLHMRENEAAGGSTERKSIIEEAMRRSLTQMGR